MTDNWIAFFIEMGSKLKALERYFFNPELFDSFM
jgi:hypothetical protein